MTIRNCIDSFQGKKRQWLACYNNLDWKSIATSAAMIRRKCPSGLLRAARISTLVLVICILLIPSSKQLKQMMEGQDSALTRPVYKEIGEASWYGSGFHGKETASGETFNTNKMTAAHPSLPLGTKVKVTNLEKDKTVEVRINDRGPYVDGRVIDLSRAAAKKLDMEQEGTTKVKVVTKAVKKKISGKKTAKKRTTKKKHKVNRAASTK